MLKFNVIVLSFIKVFEFNLVFINVGLRLVHTFGVEDYSVAMKKLMDVSYKLRKEILKMKKTIRSQKKKLRDIRSLIACITR